MRDSFAAEQGVRGRTASGGGSRALVLAVVPAGVALGVLAYEAQVDRLVISDARAAVPVAIGLAFLLAGVVAWTRRPANRLGALMVATGFALLLRQLRYSHDAFAFTFLFALGDLGYALLAHTVLAYPSGRVRDRLDRRLMQAGYATVIAFPFAVLLLHDQHDRLRQFGGLMRKSDILILRDARAVELLQQTYTVVFFGVLAALFVALVTRRLAGARTSRLAAAPLVAAAVAVSLRAAYEWVVMFGDGTSVEDSALFWLSAVAFAALPLLLLAGLLRARRAPAGVSYLVVELERASPHDLRDALARALGDPTLEVAFRLPDTESRDRAVTRLERNGELVAALVHDPALLDDPELVEGAAAAARLALENARLGAELRAQLDKVTESRARIVVATDAERRRIERDLHDGAQQRLVTLALELRAAQGRVGPETEALLDSAVAQLQAAVDELRELARGVHPAILTEKGLPAALKSLAIRAPLPVVVEAAPRERLAADVEATAYFVASEGLANVAKHARAGRAAIGARRDKGTLVVEVADDGVGGAALNGGSGLRGLVNRVEALGGVLRVESPHDGGTRLRAEIPCGS